MFSIEIGVLLVSLKIIWMMHKQTKVEHFQFWILNSIEFRLNDMSKKIEKIRKELKDQIKKTRNLKIFKLSEIYQTVFCFISLYKLFQLFCLLLHRISYEIVEHISAVLSAP